MALIDTYTYEEGADGVMVAPGNGVHRVVGEPRYSTNDAFSGQLGVLIDGVTFSRLVYLVDAPQTGSIYLRRHAGTSTHKVTIIIFSDSVSQQMAIALRKDGTLMIADASNNLALDTSSHKFNVGDTMRCDWQVTYDAGQMSLVARFFSNANLSGSVPDATLSALDIATNEPTEISIGAYNGVSIGFDTLRLWDDVSVWPEPYDSSPAGPPYTTTVWDGTQEVGVQSITVWDGSQELPAQLDAV